MKRSLISFSQLYERFRARDYYRRNIVRRRQQRVESKRRLGKAHRYVLELRRGGIVVEGVT
jgi:hypothetical protein